MALRLEYETDAGSSVSLVSSVPSSPPIALILNIELVTFPLLWEANRTENWDIFPYT